MGRIVSSATTIRVNAAGTSQLSKLAATMAPGTWAQLSVSNQNSVLGVGTVSGTMIHYCNTMPWNSKRKCIEIQAMDHAFGKQPYVRYDEASNSFIVVSADSGLTSQTQHGYDHVDVNPYTGDVYQRACRIGTGNLYAFKFAFGAGGAHTETPKIATSYDQIAIGACWWSGSFVGAGAQGCLMFFNSGAALGNANDGQIVGYNPLTNTWFFNKSGMSPGYLSGGSTYHSIMEYSAVKNVAIYGGGNDASKKLWRLNADGSYTVMPDVPAGKAVGMQAGNIVCDPVTGNFILLSAGQLWELNPDGAGKWTQMTGTRVPPAAVGIPGPSPTIDGIISTGISDYGVIAYIKQTSQSGGTFHLYKHA